jgi:two-component system sensor histidine kinase DegS
VFGKILETVDLRLQQAMNSAREDERRRLAREIHDGPAQVLSNAIFAVHTTEQIAKRAPQQVSDELSQLRELLKDGVAEIRRFMFDLRPTMLQDLGLGPTLARYVDDYSRFFAKRVTLTTDDGLPYLTPDQELTIFRIVQEALQNIHKHAGQGAEGAVDLRSIGGMVQLTITDDGRGFDPAGAVPRMTSGAGLPGMRERANLVGGDLEITSAHGQGTTITLRMPLRGQTGPLRL